MYVESDVAVPSRGQGALGPRAAATMVRSALSVPREGGTPRARGQRDKTCDCHVTAAKPLIGSHTCAIRLALVVSAGGPGTRVGDSETGNRASN